MKKKLKPICANFYFESNTGQIKVSWMPANISGTKWDVIVSGAAIGLWVCTCQPNKTNSISVIKSSLNNL